MEQEGQADQPDQENRSVAGSQYGDAEDDEEEEEGREEDDESRERADELENEKNETMDGGMSPQNTTRSRYFSFEEEDLNIIDMDMDTSLCGPDWRTPYGVTDDGRWVVKKKSRKRSNALDREIARMIFIDNPLRATKFEYIRVEGDDSSVIDMEVDTSPCGSAETLYHIAEEDGSSRRTDELESRSIKETDMSPLSAAGSQYISAEEEDSRIRANIIDMDVDIGLSGSAETMFGSVEEDGSSERTDEPESGISETTGVSPLNFVPYTGSLSIKKTSLQSSEATRYGSIEEEKSSNIADELESGISEITIGDASLQSATGTLYGSIEQDESSKRTYEQKKEISDTTIGVRQRWSTIPSTSSEQQNLVNEQLDNDNDDSSSTSEVPKKDERPKSD